MPDVQWAPVTGSAQTQAMLSAPLSHASMPSSESKPATWAVITMPVAQLSPHTERNQWPGSEYLQG